MMSFAWLLDILIAIILAVAAISATRLGTIWLTTDRLLATGPTGSRSSPRGFARSRRWHRAPANGYRDGRNAGAQPHDAAAPCLGGDFRPARGLVRMALSWRHESDALRSLVSGHRAVRLFHCAAMVYMR
jgi:hypothetical protein